MMFTSYVYEPNIYTDGVIKSNPQFDSLFITPNTSNYRFYDIKMNEIYSDHRMFSLGFNTDDYTYYSVKNGY